MLGGYGNRRIFLPTFIITSIDSILIIPSFIITTIDSILIMAALIVSNAQKYYFWQQYHSIHVFSLPQ